ncbi:MAG: cation-translocating P-type ATPase [Lachnospiraceae bacterium]|nr:cation-translocating P-type ATPase [Lachnospiraceae bacterium]
MMARAVNTKVDSSTKTAKEIIHSNVFTYFNLIFLILALLLLIAGAFRDLTFLPIIIANTCIGIFQEIRSKRVLDNLSILNAPKANVLREGEIREIAADKLVLDDVVIFSAGNQIPADAVVLDGEVSVNESLITGESDEIIKRAGDTLLSGSFIVSGKCSGQLEKVGKDSYISKLTLQATKSKDEEQSEMIRALDELLRIVGIIILPIGIVLFIQQFVFGGMSFQASVTSMVAAIIGMIPEGLYLLATVAMAVSAMRLAKQQILLHDMKCIETLARVNVLCVDKTGTITVPEMEVSGFEPVGSENKENVHQMLSDFAANMETDNATMEAMQEYFQESTGVSAERVFSFSSETKYSAAVISGCNYVLGAPEFVLRTEYAHYAEQIEQYSLKGYRVLVFGIYEGVLDGRPLMDKVRPLAFVYLSNAIRKGAIETFSYFAEREVEIKVISGDNPGTVSEIAKKAGIANAEKYIDTSTLETKEALYDAADQYTVFGRVTPKQKRQLVKALKQQGKTVAMTGDGVNDVLALKDADCSIAMASGSEAAAQVSQLVLLDSDFSRMPSVVMEGRRVVNNIQRTASLYLVKNIFSMLLAVFSMILMLDYPLEPSQLSLISMFTIGVPSFFLALEQNKDQIKGKFMSNVFIKAFPAALTNFIVVSGLVMFCREFHVDADCVSTSCTILVSIVGFMVLYRIAQPMTTGHKILIVAMIAGWLFCMLYVSHLFSITSISRQCAMLMVIFAIITEPVFRYLSMFVEFIRKIAGNINNRFKR